MSLKKRILSIATLFAFAFTSLFSPAPVLADVQKQWVELETGVDSKGNVITTRMYGYYADIEGFGRVFIVCDPDTGEENGKAYIPGAKIGERSVQKLAGYEMKRVIDFDTVKTLRPPQLSLMAPNIPTDLGLDFEHLIKTGEVRYKTDGMVKWPGSSKWECLVPDPSCWLIVAQVTNPNAWPVDVSVDAYVSAWYDPRRWDTWLGRPGASETVHLEAGETKFVKIWEGSPPNGAKYLHEDHEDDDYWTEGRCLGRIEKNYDPDLPRACGGEVAFWIDPACYWRSLPRFSTGFYIDAEKRDHKNKRLWRAEGTINWGEDGKWRYDLGRTVDYQENNAIAELEKIFNENAFLNLKWRSYSSKKDMNFEIDGVHFYNISKRSGGYEAIRGGPLAGIEGPGPVLSAVLDPLNRGRKVSPDTSINAKPAAVVNWSDDIPLLQRKYIFIERFSFVPTDSPNVGLLVKQTVPGYVFWVEDERRPYFRERLVASEIKKESLSYYQGWRVRTYIFDPNKGWVYQGEEKLNKFPSWAKEVAPSKAKYFDFDDYDYYRITAKNATLDIDLVNPLSAPVEFHSSKENLKFLPAYKGVFRGVDYWAYEAKMVSSKDIGALDSGKKKVTAGPKETVDVLDTSEKIDITVIASVWDYYKIQRKVNPLIDSVLGGEREACLYLNSGDYYFGIEPSEEYVSLASMKGLYTYKKDGKKRRKYYTIGFADFFNNQYFNEENLTDGLVIAPSDALYPEILKQIVKTARFTNTSSRKRFWPVYYDSKDRYYDRFSPPYFNTD